MSKGVSLLKKTKIPLGVLLLLAVGNTTEQQVETCKLLLLKRQVFLLDKKQEENLCARMSKVKGPLKKDGKLTRKALALRKWNCGSV